MNDLGGQLPLVRSRKITRPEEHDVVPRPFLKWAGGKSQLLAQYARYFPNVLKGTYHEPFLGGGAVYFCLRPPKAVLSDLNSELIRCYRVIKDRPEELISDLLQHENTPDYYYHLRSLDPAAMSDVERASRTIYLNKTCYNGLYRVNRTGQFNVPFGRYLNPRFCEPENIRAVSRQLQSAELLVASFERVLQRAKKGDFIYFDPPYHPLSPTSNFTAYTKGAFGVEDQRKLAKVFEALDSRGCLVMLSNSATPLVSRFYKRYAKVRVSASRAINSVASRRGRVSELLILNYQP